LLIQATERDSAVAQGIMVRQLMATYRAVQDAHRAIGAGRTGGGRMQSDGLEEPVEDLTTVAVTVAARARDEEGDAAAGPGGRAGTVRRRTGGGERRTQARAATARLGLRTGIRARGRPAIGA